MSYQEPTQFVPVEDFAAMSEDVEGIAVTVIGHEQELQELRAIVSALTRRLDTIQGCH